VLGAALATVTVAALLVGRGALTVTQCVSGAGLGRLGLGLALLRVDEACPSGTLAVGGDQHQVMGVVVVVALPVLTANLLGATLGIGVLRRLGGMVRVLVAALGALRLRLPRPVSLPPAATQQVEIPVEVPTTRAVVGVPWWRGPPQVGCA